MKRAGEGTQILLLRKLISAYINGWITFNGLYPEIYPVLINAARVKAASAIPTAPAIIEEDDPEDREAKANFERDQEKALAEVREELARLKEEALEYNQYWNHAENCWERKHLTTGKIQREQTRDMKDWYDVC
jgi:hypothetical protein